MKNREPKLRKKANPFIYCALVWLLSANLETSFLHAARPEGTVAKSNQLDIDELEKAIGVKFSKPFPSARFDIDYFYKGDLALIPVGKRSVPVTCPYVVGPMITFSIGTGSGSKSFERTADVSIDYNDSGKAVRIYIRHEKIKPWPKSNEGPARKDQETDNGYLDRVTKYWKAVAEKTNNPEAAKDQLGAALRVASACLKQGKVGEAGLKEPKATKDKKSPNASK